MLNLCVSALCIVTSHSSHGLYERQAEDDFNQALYCEALAIAEQCTNGYAQVWTNVLLDCDDVEMAQLLQDSCRRNSMGQYCNIGSRLQRFIYILSISLLCVTILSTVLPPVAHQNAGIHLFAPAMN